MSGRRWGADRSDLECHAAELVRNLMTASSRIRANNIIYLYRQHDTVTFICSYESVIEELRWYLRREDIECHLVPSEMCSAFPFESKGIRTGDEELDRVPFRVKHTRAKAV